MEIVYKRIDTGANDFDTEFTDCEQSFFYILSKAYHIYYGIDYHKKRIIDGKAIIYLAYVDNVLVGVSYVKINCRRGGTAIYPESFRRLGLAENLVKLSLKDFPRQYSILSTNLEHSHKMLSLMNKLGFKEAKTVQEIKAIVGEEFHLLSNFKIEGKYLTFDRESERRGGENRKSLTLMHTF